MPADRYKHVTSRFQQWRILPADCKSWIEHRDGQAPEGAEAGTAPPASASTAAATTAAAGRMSGDLPENVTEERLYQSRLFDLARERHKMIQESDYVRNQFIDHQVRKARSRNLGRLLEGLDIEQYRNKSASGVERLHQRSAHARLTILASKVLGLSIDEASKFSEDELRQRLNMPTSAAAAVVVAAEAEAAEAPPEADAPSPPPGPLPPRPSTSRTQLLTPYPGGWPSEPGGSRRGSSRPGSTASALFPRVSMGGGGERSGHRRQSSSYRARSSVAVSGFSPAAVALSSTPGQLPPDRRPRTASARRRVQSDPRCVQLINTLTPRYKLAGKTPDVSAIIRANPSLCPPAELDGVPEEQRQLQQQRLKATKVRRTRQQILELLDSMAKTRYYEAKNLATLS